VVALRDPDSSFSVRPPGVVRGTAREVGSLIRRGLGGCAVDLVAGGGFAVAGRGTLLRYLALNNPANRCDFGSAAVARLRLCRERSGGEP